MIIAIVRKSISKTFKSMGAIGTRLFSYNK